MNAAFQYHTETMAGIEIQKPFPKKLHALIQMYLLILLKSTLPQEYRVLPELNVICSGDRIVPDLTVYAGAAAHARGAKFEDGDLVDAPLLAVEIASPGQAFSDLLSKCERLVNAGTPMTWIILPEKRQGWTFSASGLAQATDKLRACSIEISLAEMWDQMDKEN